MTTLLKQTKSYLSTLDTDHLAGKLIVGGFDGHRLSAAPKFRELLETSGLGGAILFRRNVDTPEQVKELTDSIRAAAYWEPGAPGLVHSPIIAVDQEGGKVARLRPPHFTKWPPMGKLGETGDLDLAFRVGTAMGTELLSVGINMNCAPVADVNTNPDNPIINDRSFSPDPETVGQMASAFARGLHSVGVASSMKHFPGHGDTLIDSHLDLPVVTNRLSTLRNRELVPFRMGMEARIPSVLTAHVLLSELDRDHPATLSRAILTGLLREELGFKGVIMTDDLEMAAITERYSIEEVVNLGLDAGIDIFLICHSQDLQLRAVEELVRLVETGAVPRSRLEESVLRIETMKLTCWAAGEVKMRQEWPEHQELADSI